MADFEKSGPIYRTMVRCQTPACRRWWSLAPGVQPELVACVACAGVLATHEDSPHGLPFVHDEVLKIQALTLPYAPFIPVVKP